MAAWKGTGSFTLVENRHAAAGHGHNLIGEEMDVHPLHAVSLHALECEPREVPGAGGDAAEGVFGHTFHRKSGYELAVVPEVVGDPHVFDRRMPKSRESENVPRRWP